MDRHHRAHHARHDDRSLLEGVTCGMRDALEIMNEMQIPSRKCEPAAEGRSAFWRQLQADIYNQPIVLTNASEGAAYGVALLAGVGTGVWKSVEEACRVSIKQTAKITPNKSVRRYTTAITRRITSCMAT